MEYGVYENTSVSIVVKSWVVQGVELNQIANRMIFFTFLKYKRKNTNFFKI